MTFKCQKTFSTVDDLWPVCNLPHLSQQPVVSRKVSVIFNFDDDISAYLVHRVVMRQHTLAGQSVVSHLTDLLTLTKTLTDVTTLLLYSTERLPI